jgi:site-specific recombinase XerC
MRLPELAGLTVDDLDTDDDVTYVLGKGRRPRGCAANRQQYGRLGEAP